MFVNASEGLVEVKRTHSFVSPFTFFLVMFQSVDVTRSSGFSFSEG